MKIPLYSLFILLLLLFAFAGSGCKAIKKWRDGRKNIRTDTIVVRKDTQPVIVKVDTLRYCDTLPPRNYERLIVCFEKVEGKIIRRDTVGKIDLSAQRRIDSLAQIEDQRRKDSIALVESKKPQKKENYRVVILMPFMASSSRVGENDAKSLRSVEFYEGAQMAFDSLRRMGVDLSINVFDTQDSDSVLQLLLQREELMKADLIIGPIASDELRTVARFAAAYHIPVISPLSPRTVVENDNPYFLQINPSYSTHIQHVLRYSERMPIRRSKHFIVAGTKDDSLYIEQCQFAYQEYKKDSLARMEVYVPKEGNKFDDDQFRSLTRRGSLNIIFVPCLKENYVSNLLRTLTSEGTKSSRYDPTKRQEDYLIVGMSQWKYFENISYDYFEKLRLHMTSESFVDPTSLSAMRFKDSYFSRYGMPPRDFGYVGFDVMLYAGKMLHKHGTGFFAELEKEPYEGKQTRFVIRPVTRTYKVEENGVIKEKTAVSYYENTYINILHYEEFSLKKVETP